MKYRCYFELLMSRAEARVECLADVKDGFWLNERQQFTKGSDACIWIPPSRIIFVEKL